MNQEEFREEYFRLVERVIVYKVTSFNDLEDFTKLLKRIKDFRVKYSEYSILEK